MSTSHSDEAAVTFGASEFLENQKHSDNALTNQMSFRILSFSSPVSYTFHMTQK